MPCKKKSFATRCARSAHCCWCILARVEAHYSVDFYLSQQGCTHSKNGSVPGRAPTSASAKKLMVALTRLCIWRSRGWSTAQAAQPDARAASATRRTPCCLVGSEFSIARRSPLAPATPPVRPGGARVFSDPRRFWRNGPAVSPATAARGVPGSIPPSPPRPAPSPFPRRRRRPIFCSPPPLLRRF